MKNFLLFFISILIFAACDKKKNNEAHFKSPDKKILMEADFAFSEMSRSKGMKIAFIEFIDSNGILLRPEHLPIAGANAIDYLIQQNDAHYTLTWEPQNAEISLSGEMGFTYGVYALKPSSNDTTIYGTYISIWKKQKDGKWKFVLDSRNEGVGDDAF